MFGAAQVEENPPMENLDVPVFSLELLQAEGISGESVTQDSTNENNVSEESVNELIQFVNVNPIARNSAVESVSAEVPPEEPAPASTAAVIVLEEEDESNGPPPVKKPREYFGRPKSRVWDKFTSVKVNGRNMSRCNRCFKNVSSKAERLEKHVEMCEAKAIIKQRHSDAVSVPTVVSAPAPDSAKQSGMFRWLDTVSKTEKSKIDKTLAEFLFANNLPFSLSEDETFLKLIKALRPSYAPPSRFEIGSSLLDQIYNEKTTEMKHVLSGKKVTIMQDGWTSIQNDPVLVHAASDGRRTVFLNASSAEDNVKTSEYCFEQLENAIQNAEQSFGVQVIGCVTDNCNSMRCLRRIVAEKYPHFFVFGCNTHLLNLIGKDLTDKPLMENVLAVQKYFKNHTVESECLKKLKGKRPVLPADTRWNSQVDVFKNYVENHTKYLEIARDRKSSLFGKNDNDINKILLDGTIYGSVSTAIQKLEPIALFLDQVNCF